MQMEINITDRERKSRARRETARAFLKSVRKEPILYLMMLPGILFYVLFKYVPMYGVLIAFQDYKITRGMFRSEWVGFKHFHNFFMKTPEAWQLVWNTIYLNILELAIVFPAPIVLAVLLNEIRHTGFKRLVQSISYMPHFLSTVVIVGMVLNFIASNGIVNAILMNWFGWKEPILFMQMPEWFRSIYIGSELWQTVGWGTILYLAAIAGADPTLYEAARIDGANRWQQIRHITFVSMVPVIVILLILNLGKMMEIGYQKIILLYNPLVYSTADVINTYVYRRGLVQSDFSFATAVGLFQSTIGFLLVYASNKLARRYSENSLW